MSRYRSSHLSNDAFTTREIISTIKATFENTEYVRRLPEWSGFARSESERPSTSDGRMTENEVNADLSQILETFKVLDRSKGGAGELSDNEEGLLQYMTVYEADHGSEEDRVLGRIEAHLYGLTRLINFQRRAIAPSCRDISHSMRTEWITTQIEDEDRNMHLAAITEKETARKKLKLTVRRKRQEGRSEAARATKLTRGGKKVSRPLVLRPAQHAGLC